jgi:cytochrome c oxidase subunit 2
VTADEAYMRDSILEPGKDIVAGYAPVMPSFRGNVTEDDMVKLIAYLKSLSSSSSPPATVRGAEEAGAPR